jgi:WD40 repeat protein
MNESKNELLDADGVGSFDNETVLPPGITKKRLEDFIADRLRREEAGEVAEELSADPILYARTLAAREAYRRFVSATAPRPVPGFEWILNFHADPDVENEPEWGRRASFAAGAGQAGSAPHPGFARVCEAKEADSEESPVAMFSFSRLNEEFREYRGRRGDFVLSLMHPHPRVWFRACHALLHGESDEGCSAELWEAIEDQREPEAIEMARLHVELARTLRTHGRSLDAAAPAIDALAGGFGGPKGFILDLAQELLTEPGVLEGVIRKAGKSAGWHGDLRPAEREARVPGILVECHCHADRDDAFIAFLDLEVVVCEPSAPGSLHLYPAPAMALWSRDASFREAERTAEEYARRIVPGDLAVEVRWRLARGKARPLAARICGPSLGLAFGFLVRRLFAEPDEPIARVSIATVAFIGRLKTDGTVSPVGGIVDKLNVDGVDTIMIPVQDIADAHPTTGMEQRDPGGGAVPVLTVRNGAVRILPVTDVDHAANLLSVDYDGRCQGIGCELPPKQPDYVGRESLTAEILRFVRDAESGYGLVVGGMGSGKTSFMKRLLHHLDEEGCLPAFDFVPPPPTVLRRGENVAKNLYYRLRRRHVTAEPEAWKEWNITQKLEELLNYLSQKYTGTSRKVVMVLDGADEVELPAGSHLLPGILPAKLPPGVVCIISSTLGAELSTADNLSRGAGRTVNSAFDLRWLYENELIKEWFGIGGNLLGVPACTDEWADVREYLLRQTHHRMPAKLIDQIVSQRQPPVFFTVVKGLTELRNGRRQELLEKPELWIEPPKELIRGRIDEIIRLAARRNNTEADVWDALGTIALVREPVSEDQLGELDLWRDSIGDCILTEGRSFFVPFAKSRPRRQQPICFSHPGYPRVIREVLDDFGKEGCHRKLAERCRNWRALKGPGRRYALRYAPSHLRRAGMWEELYELLSDFAYLEARLEALPASAQAGDNPAEQADESPQLRVSRLVRAFEQAVETGRGFPAEHPRRGAMKALNHVIDSASHVFQDRPHLLVQHIFNEMIRERGRYPDLDRKLDLAIEKPPRLVLKRLNCPEAPPEGLRRRVFTGHRKAVNSVALSPNEEIIASGSSDTTVMLWQVATGDHVHILRGHSKEIRSVAWSRDGCLIASAGENVRLWNPATGECLREIPMNDEAAVVAFSPSEDVLAVAGTDGSLQLFDASGENRPAVLRKGGPKIRCLRFSRDGRLLALGGADMMEGKGAVDLYETATRTHLRTLPKLHNWAEGLAFTPADKMLAVGTGVETGEIWLFDVGTGSFKRTVPVHQSGVRALAISENRILVTGSFDHTLGLRHLENFDVLRTDMAHGNAVLSVAISADGNLVVSAGADHLVKVWNITPAPAQSSQNAAAKVARTAHRDTIHAMRFSSDGRLVATASKDRSAIIFPADRGEACRAFTADGATVNVSGFSPDGKMLAIGSKGIIKIVDLGSGKEMLCLRGHASWVLDLAWTHDSERLVSVSEDQTAMVWNARTGALLHTLKAHTARLRAVAVAPDGRTVATTGDDTKICVWDMETGRLLRTLHGHTLRVKALAWSRDGLLASAGSDEFIKLWDPATGRECGSLRARAQEIWTLQFAPGRYLAAGSADGMALIFGLEKGLAEVACLACGDAVQALWFSADGTEFRVAARGGADLVPTIYITRIVPQAEN